VCALLRVHAGGVAHAAWDSSAQRCLTTANIVKHAVAKALISCRGGESSMDVSADLTELGRTPVAVVCAGAKSVSSQLVIHTLSSLLGAPLLQHAWLGSHPCVFMCCVPQLCQ
jgi:hypothetical protein